MTNSPNHPFPSGYIPKHSPFPSGYIPEHSRFLAVNYAKRKVGESVAAPGAPALYAGARVCQLCGMETTRLATRKGFRCCNECAGDFAIWRTPNRRQRRNPMWPVSRWGITECACGHQHYWGRCAVCGRVDPELSALTQSLTHTPPPIFLSGGQRYEYVPEFAVRSAE